MKTQIFRGHTSREVLHKVKQALGDDALILSNRACDGGIEVIALSHADLASATAVNAESARDGNQHASTPSALPAALTAATPQQTPTGAPGEPPRLAGSAPRFETRTEQVVQHFRPLAEVTPAPAPVAAIASAAPAAADIDGILSEIQNLKATLRNDIAAFATMENAASASRRSTILRDLLKAGFSAKLSRRIADEMQCNAGNEHMPDRLAIRLSQEVAVAQPDEMIERGGVYALVGPTGVGKTTTIAKIAARAVVRFGAAKVALLTTDGYRIGAHDQLRIYARILGVPVHAVRDANDLAMTLADLSTRHLVLIDTIGMSQRDRMVAEQAAMLAGDNVKRLLLVSATANAATLNQVVSVYHCSGVHGCILTKIDEAASLTPVLDAVIRHKLPVHYVTDGQRVPEDLQLPEPAALVREALQPADEVFELTPDELDLIAEPEGVQAVAPLPQLSAEGAHSPVGRARVDNTSAAQRVQVVHG